LEEKPRYRKSPSPNRNNIDLEQVILPSKSSIFSSALHIPSHTTSFKLVVSAVPKRPFLTHAHTSVVKSHTVRLHPNSMETLRLSAVRVKSTASYCQMWRLWKGICMMMTDDGMGWDECQWNDFVGKACWMIANVDLNHQNVDNLHRGNGFAALSNPKFQVSKRPM
jgi:hypothetical protein